MPERSETPEVNSHREFRITDVDEPRPETPRAEATGLSNSEMLRKTSRRRVIPPQRPAGDNPSETESTEPASTPGKALELSRNTEVASTRPNDEVASSRSHHDETREPDLPEGKDTQKQPSKELVPLRKQVPENLEAPEPRNPLDRPVRKVEYLPGSGRDTETWQNPQDFLSRIRAMRERAARHDALARLQPEVPLDRLTKEARRHATPGSDIVAWRRAELSGTQQPTDMAIPASAEQQEHREPKSAAQEAANLPALRAETEKLPARHEIAIVDGEKRTDLGKEITKHLTDAQEPLTVEERKVVENVEKAYDGAQEQLDATKDPKEAPEVTDQPSPEASTPPEVKSEVKDTPKQPEEPAVEAPKTNEVPTETATPEPTEKDTAADAPAETAEPADTQQEVPRTHEVPLTGEVFVPTRSGYRRVLGANESQRAYTPPRFTRARAWNAYGTPKDVPTRGSHTTPTGEYDPRNETFVRGLRERAATLENNAEHHHPARIQKTMRIAGAAALGSLKTTGIEAAGSFGALPKALFGKLRVTEVVKMTKGWRAKLLPSRVKYRLRVQSGNRSTYKTVRAGSEEEAMGRVSGPSRSLRLRYSIARKLN